MSKPLLARPTRLLLVSPNRVLRDALIAVAGTTLRVDVSREFPSARKRLTQTSYDLLVTPVRLQEYNGLHLVYLAKQLSPATHAVVYDEFPDRGFAADARRAGAFYELTHRLAITLPAFIGRSLPDADRRTLIDVDRRALPRGGRRRWDRYVIGVASSSPDGSTPAEM
jgi:DNA-binding NtrC family response regulator